MFDGVVQSALIFFLILYAYDTTTSRADGYAVYQYEFATTMAVSAVTAANLFNGMNTAAWTGWVFFAVALGIVIVWVYTAAYSAIMPSWFSTPIFGNNAYLWPSAYFWFGILLTVVLALLPRYICKAYKFSFDAGDIDRVRWLHKLEPDRDFSEYKGSGLAGLKPSVTRRSKLGPHHPFANFVAGSRTDMSTGMRSQHRGFDFATEENGVALQRMQTNLSERQKHPFRRRRRNGSLLPSFSLSRSLRRKKPPAVPETPPSPESSYSHH